MEICETKETKKGDRERSIIFRGREGKRRIKNPIIVPRAYLLHIVISMVSIRYVSECRLLLLSRPASLNNDDSASGTAC